TKRPRVPVAGVPVVGVAVVSILPPFASRCLFGGDETVTVPSVVQCPLQNRCKLADGEQARRVAGSSRLPRRGRALNLLRHHPHPHLNQMKNASVRLRLIQTSGIVTML